MAYNAEVTAIDETSGDEPTIDHLLSCTINGLSLSPGTTVEFQESDSSSSGPDRQPFLRIKYIVHDLITDEIYLRGWIFRRCWTFGAIFKGKEKVENNSVCLVLEVLGKESSDAFVQGMINVPARHAIAVRHIEITNSLYPSRSFRGVGDCIFWTKERIVREAKLVCRWVLVKYFNDKQRKRSGKFRNMELRRPTESECDSGSAVKDSELFKAWRSLLPTPASGHTFADAFCGAGGASEGAAQTGLRVELAFDSNRKALDTYRMNRSATEAFHATVDQFVAIIGGDMRPRFVDVLHISSPCQWCSPANTHGGPMDEENEATMYSVEALVENLRPRVVTLEQTDGIFFRHYLHFQKLLSFFTRYNYSVRSTIMQFMEHGMCQSRSRLIIFAACPGTTLPEFPAPTHGPACILPYNTIADILLPLIILETSESRVTWHNKSAMNKRDDPPYSPYSQVPTLTTSPTNTYHYTGLRGWTPREYACMQGFPIDFHFAPTLTMTDVRKQIGNAVPPVIAKRLFLKVIRALETDDLRLHAEDKTLVKISCDTEGVN